MRYVSVVSRGALSHAPGGAAGSGRCLGEQPIEQSRAPQGDRVHLQSNFPVIAGWVAGRTPDIHTNSATTPHVAARRLRQVGKTYQT